MMSLVSLEIVVLTVAVLRPMSSFYVPYKVMVISAIVHGLRTRTLIWKITSWFISTHRFEFFI